MAMVMTSSDAQIAQKEAEAKEIEETRHAAQLLSSREDGKYFATCTCLKTRQITLILLCTLIMSILKLLKMIRYTFFVLVSILTQAYIHPCMSFYANQ